MFTKYKTAKILFHIFFLAYCSVSAQISGTEKQSLSEDSTVSAGYVLDRYIDAVGGRENLSKIVDKRTILKGISGDTEINVEVLQKAPNKVYQSFEAGPMTQETMINGETGRQIAMGREQVLEGSFLESIRIQSVLNLELNYLKFGVNPVYSGVDTVDNTKAYKIIWQLPNGLDWIYYYAVDSGLLVKQFITHDTGQGTYGQTNFLYDYKEIDGVKFPHRFVQIAAGQVYELKVELLEVNTGIDDSEFE